MKIYLHKTKAYCSECGQIVQYYNTQTVDKDGDKMLRPKHGCYKCLCILCEFENPPVAKL